MRTRIMLIAVASVFSVVVSLTGFGQVKYTPKANEEIYGTWTNTDQTTWAQKTVSGPAGHQDYWSTADSIPWAEGVDEIYSKWTDSEGNIWYKILSTGTGGYTKGYMAQMLEKLSRSGTALESVYTPVTTFDPGAFPTKIDPQDSTYCIYYRAK